MGGTGLFPFYGDSTYVFIMFLYVSRIPVLMSEFSLKSETEIRAYCLMPNHVHLVMEPAEEDGNQLSAVISTSTFSLFPP
jgi:REP element-mobilizing transposase RayT